MNYRQYCIETLIKASETLRTEYGVKSLCVLGSVARGDDREGSDVDLLVDMPPKALKIVALKYYLQNILGRGVDVIRSRSNLDPFLLSEINRDGITIFA
ncbi:MAG: nucleotidyltransferase domain-containing protein [Muribaculaceae bacterium]|nr:nucleotidyltransferase domain-containing protein [Muribaculaceae bacterium]